MANYYFNNDRDKDVAFASYLSGLANDIISRRIRLIEADHQRETETFDSVFETRASLTGRETLSIHFHRLSQHRRTTDEH